MILCPCKFFWHRAKYHQIQLPLLWVLLHATRPKCSYYITHVKWSSLMSNKNTFFMNDVLVNQPLDPATQLGENIMQRRRLNLYTMQRDKMVATASLYWQSWIPWATWVMDPLGKMYWLTDAWEVNEKAAIWVSSASLPVKILHNS